MKLFSRYLAINEPEATEFDFEQIAYIQNNLFLFNLFLVIYSKNKLKSLKFNYTKYESLISKPVELDVYSIKQRDRSLFIIGKEKKSNITKQYMFMGMNDLEIQFDKKFNSPESKTVEHYYINSLSNYKDNTNPKKVLIQFSKESNFFIHKEFFQRNQKITLQDDGSYILEIKSQKARDVFNIVSKFMNYAELLEPIEWREEFTTNLEKSYLKHKKIH